MDVLLTGASGHVGGAILRALLQQGHRVSALGRSPVDAPGVESFTADLTCAKSLAEALATISPHDALVHAAAVIDEPVPDATLHQANVLSFEALAQWHRAMGGSRLVFISSLGVIGCPPPHAITEREAVQPPTAYHASKVAGEAIVESIRAHLPHACSLRISSPVGPGMRRRQLFSIFVQRAMRGEPLEVAGIGARRQNFVDVRDIAEAALCCLNAGELSACYNIAGARAVSTLELAEACVRGLGSSSEIRIGATPCPEDAVAWQVSIARAQKELGWAPRHNIEDSIRACADARA
jgi:nucleoside-diphosphate-sugar epimerase